MADRTQHVSPERQVELWSAFVDVYSSTTTRPVVDVFLRGLIGGPRAEDRGIPKAA